MVASPTTQAIRSFVFNGQPEVARVIYDRFVEAGAGSAETHLAGFMATQDRGASREALLEIQARAEACANYEDTREDFADEWLVFNARANNQ